MTKSFNLDRYEATISNNKIVITEKRGHCHDKSEFFPNLVYEHVKTLFASSCKDYIPSLTLIDELKKVSSTWEQYNNYGLNAYHLARLLKVKNIYPRNLRVPGACYWVRGYKREDFCC